MIFFSFFFVVVDAAIEFRGQSFESFACWRCMLFRFLLHPLRIHVLFSTHHFVLFLAFVSFYSDKCRMGNFIFETMQHQWMLENYLFSILPTRRINRKSIENETKHFCWPFLGCLFWIIRTIPNTNHFAGFSDKSVKFESMKSLIAELRRSKAIRHIMEFPNMSGRWLQM